MAACAPMRMPLVFTITAVLASFAASAAAAEPIKVPYTKLQLANGMTVVLHEDHSVPRVHFTIRYKVGSARETPGRTGFAHLFEHLMFEGSKNVPEGKFDEWLEAVGGENNAYTSEDVTFYYEEVPSNAVELPLFLDSDRMGFFAEKLSDGLVDGQRDVVKNERRQSFENRPWGDAQLLLPAAVWPKGHPYSWPVIGSMEDLSAASIEDVKSFYTKWYSPGNAIMVVVGDFDTPRMRALIEKWFADVPDRGRPPAAAPMHHRLPAEKRLLVEDDSAPLPRLMIVYPTVEMFHPDDALLDLASDVLSKGAGSRLTRRLVHELQIAQDVNVYQESREQAGQLTIDVIAQPEVKLEQVRTVVDEELAKLLAGGIRDEELARAKNGVETRVADALDSLSEKAERLSLYEARLGEPDSFERDLARYRNATSAQVVEAAKRHLGKGRVVMSVVPKGRPELAVSKSASATGGAR